MERKKAYDDEEAVLKTKLESLVKSYKATVIHKGNSTIAYESGLDKISVKKGTIPLLTLYSIN